MKKILVVDGYAIIRKLLIRYFSELNLAYEVEEALTRDQALKKMDEVEFDLILIDTSQPLHNGLETMIDIKQKAPEMPVMIVSGSSESRQYKNFVLLGCNAYLPRNASWEEILQTAVSILEGSLYSSQNIIQALEENEPDKYLTLIKKLSRRELQVFLKLATGTSTKSMSNQLQVSSSTVSVIKSQIMKKLDFDNDYELFQFALDAEMVPARHFQQRAYKSDNSVH